MKSDQLNNAKKFLSEFPRSIPDTERATAIGELFSGTTIDQVLQGFSVKKQQAESFLRGMIDEASGYFPQSNNEVYVAGFLSVKQYNVNQ
jgi:hypothetical protein